MACPHGGLVAALIPSPRAHVALAWAVLSSGPIDLCVPPRRSERRPLDLQSGVRCLRRVLSGLHRPRLGLGAVSPAVRVPGVPA